MMPIEGVGLYVGKERISRNGVREVRLSVDGMHVWKEQLTKRVFVLSEEQEGEWFLGKDIELGGGGWNASLVGGSKMTPGFVSVKSGDDFVGMGKIGVDGDMLYNFLPKERRRRN
jgi:NOL1/NOP2/fmu family ribosome biogenesis protein